MHHPSFSAAVCNRNKRKVRRKKTPIRIDSIISIFFLFFFLQKGKSSKLCVLLLLRGFEFRYFSLSPPSSRQSLASCHRERKGKPKVGRTRARGGTNMPKWHRQKFSWTEPKKARVHILFTFVLPIDKCTAWLIKVFFLNFDVCWRVLKASYIPSCCCSCQDAQCSNAAS